MIKINGYINIWIKGIKGCNKSIRRTIEDSCYALSTNRKLKEFKKIT